jgi:uncharacterized LabA/DUF88 family protein
MEFVYVDNSNLYIEGRRVSAVKEGYEENIQEAMRNGTFDHGYTISFGKLYQFLCGDGTGIKRAALFGSRPPPNDSIWKFAEKAGFTLHLEDRNAANKEKKIDTGIATMMTKDAYKSADPKNDTLVLVAGDSDYVPTLKALQEDGYKIEVVFWDHAAYELKNLANKFISLNEHLENLRL